MDGIQRAAHLRNWNDIISQEKSMYDITSESLLRAIELEEVRLKAQEEIKLRDQEISQLKERLTSAIIERDQAQEKCQKLFLEKCLLQQQLQQQQQLAPNSGISSNIDHNNSSHNNKNNNNNINNYLSSSDSEESIVSSPVHSHHVITTTSSSEVLAINHEKDYPIAISNPLPEKGQFLQAVIKAGPLLQTLLLAGPLPKWRHPPPPFDTCQIPPPPVVAPQVSSVLCTHSNNMLQQSATTHQDHCLHLMSEVNVSTNTTKVVSNNCGRANCRKRSGFGDNEGTCCDSSSELKYQRAVLQ